MFLDSTILSKLDEKQFYIATPDRTILGNLHALANITYEFNAIEYSFIKFEIYDVDNNDCFKDVKINNKIFVQDIGWFVLIEPEENYDEAGSHFKSCTMYSAEYELQNRQLDNFIINMGIDGSVDDVTLYYPDDENVSLIHMAFLKYFPNWSIRNVDPLLTGKYNQECFEVSETTIYSFLMENVSKVFRCVFLFDIINYTVDIVKVDNLGNDTTIYITQNNLIKSLTKNIVSDDNIATCLNVLGEDIDIFNVNIGTNKIYNFSYYYETIRSINESLYNKILVWNTARDNARENYITLSIRYDIISTTINDYEYTMYPEDNSDTTWTKYSVYYLQSLVDNKTISKEQFESSNPNIATDTTDPNYEFYQSLVTDINNINLEISNKNNTISSLKSQKSSYQSQMNTLYLSLDYEYYFTVDEKKILSNYIYEKSYTDSTYIKLSTDTDGYIDSSNVVHDGTTTTKERNLLAQGSDALNEMCLPQYEIQCDIVNLFKIDEFKVLHNQFNLCDFMTVYFSPRIWAKLRLIQLKGNFDKGSEFDVKFSNMTRNKGTYDDLDNLLDSAFGRNNNISLSSNYSSGSATSEGVSIEQVQLLVNNALLSSGANFTYSDIQKIQNLVDGKFTSLSGDLIEVDELDALVANLVAITSDSITNNYLNTKYANIDFANVETASVGTFLANIGLITSATIVDGHITGYLDAVEVNANSITTGTLVADRILLKGSSSGLLYALNNLGELTSTAVDTLDAHVLTDRTITADKIVAKAITANEIAVNAVTAEKIAVNAVTAKKIAVATLSAISANLGTVTAGIIRSTNYVSGSTGMQLNLATGVWDSKYFKIAANGAIASTSGTIAGWIIGVSPLSSLNKAIYSTSSNYIVGLQSSSVDTDLVLFVKNATDMSDVTYIRHNGKFYSSNAEITGSITANSGIIGGWGLSDTKIYKDTLCADNYIRRVWMQPVIDDLPDETWIYSIQKARSAGSVPGGFNGIWYVASNGDMFTNNIEANSIEANGCISAGGGISMVANNTGVVSINAVTGYSSTLAVTATRFAASGTNYPQIYGNGTYLVLGYGNAQSLQLDSSKRFMPTADNTYTLGYSGFRWKQVYAATGAISTSDRNQKKDIEELDCSLAYRFVMGLKPDKYRFIQNDSDRFHYGLVAQDVEQLMKDLDMSSKDFAGFIKSPKVQINEETKEETVIENEYDYGLRYEEFIAPLIKMIQIQDKRICELEQQVLLMQSG